MRASWVTGTFTASCRGCSGFLLRAPGMPHGDEGADSAVGSEGCQPGQKGGVLQRCQEAQPLPRAPLWARAEATLRPGSSAHGHAVLGPPGPGTLSVPTLVQFQRQQRAAGWVSSTGHRCGRSVVPRWPACCSRLEAYRPTMERQHKNPADASLPCLGLTCGQPGQALWEEPRQWGGADWVAGS